ncbi:hypothetical protein BB560_005805 [Smittium megazygosporum]|uniref:Band 7 domain-containing protein n=1 Tax=Smittium megazygosporum TaxID=133381 RepID=A0A2T9YVT6_9FUNG|nr:hypothetical protein BB560_005805 [Smittium megazygosporum]
MSGANYLYSEPGGSESPKKRAYLNHDTTITQQMSAPVLEFNPPKFAVEHPVSSDSLYESFMNTFGSVIGVLGQIPCCICCPNPFKTIDQGTIGLISRFGKYYKTTDPGLIYVNPVTESIECVDVKIKVSTLSSIPIVTKDNVNIAIDSAIYWHIIDPYSATYGVGNVDVALVERSQTALRSVLGNKTLQELIENREVIAEDIALHIDRPARSWGVKVESILIKDIIFSNELRTALASAATQTRIGESKIITARAEVESAKLMREAADILNTPAAMQIRYLDTLQAMSKNSGSKVIFIPLTENANGAGQLKVPTVDVKNGDASREEVKDDSHSQVSVGATALSQPLTNAVLYDSLSHM